MSSDFRLEVDKNHKYSNLLVKSKCVAKLLNAGSVNTAELDVTKNIHKPRISGSKIMFDITGNIWKRKVLVYEFFKDYFTVHLEVKGEGKIEDVIFHGAIFENGKFSLYRKKPVLNYHMTEPRGYKLPNPYKFFVEGSIPGFRRYFNPDPNVMDKQFFPYWEDSEITIYNNKNFYWGNWLFNPGPFMLALESTRNRYLFMGIACRHGENRYSGFYYHGGEEFCLSLSYDGYTRVNGKWESPKLIFGIASNPYKAIEKYSQALSSMKLAKRYHHKSNCPKWWLEQGLYCSWGDQMAESGFWQNLLVSKKSKKGLISCTELCTEKNIRRYLRDLEKNNLAPNKIIIDYGWAKFDTRLLPDKKKWPDLKEFIAEQHRKNRHVIMWLGQWFIAGLKQDECILKDGKKDVCDPTNPSYQKRLSKAVYKLLSPGGYNADGLKIDFTNKGPQGKGYQVYNNSWGIELLYTYFKVIYEAAKKAKPDSVIYTQTPHPYFVDVADVMRLNDMYIFKKDLKAKIVHRVKVAKAVSKDWPVNIDNHPCASIKDWLINAKVAKKYGVLHNCYARTIEFSGEKISKKDYNSFRKALNIK